jgi:hypothetical protein
MVPDIDFMESYDRDSIIRELQRIAGVTGKTTVTKRDITSHGRVSHSTIARHFGSLRSALHEAGLTAARFTKATDEELIAILIDLWTKTLEQFGRSPEQREVKQFGYPVSYDTFVRRWGTWRKALVAAAASVNSIEETPEPTLLEQSKLQAPRARKALSLTKRFFVFKRDQYKCRICGRAGVALEVDHIVPFARGGSDALDNLQALCFDCNRGKRHSFQ